MYKYCGQCGNQAQQGALYCVKCGAIIGNTVPRVNFTPPQAPFIPPTNSVNTSMSERRTATFSIQDIHSLCVSCKVFNIEILRSKGEEIEITWDETGSWSLSTEKVNSCLRLDEENYLGFQNFADFFSPQQHKSLSIALPTGYVGPLCLENETGCISIVGIIVEGKVEAKSTVGHIGVKNLKTNAGLHVEAHAGGIDILHVEADEEICVSSTLTEL